MKKGMLSKSTVAVLSAALMVQPVTAMASELSLPSGMDLTITAGVEGESQQAQQVGQYLDNSYIFFGAQATEDGALANYVINFAGAELFKALLEINDDKASLELPGVDENVYTMRFEAIEGMIEEIMNSQMVLDPNSIPAPPFEEEQMLELFNKYIDPIGTAFQQNMTVNEDAVELTHMGLTFEGGNAIATITGDQAAEVLNTYADMIENDKELDKLIGDWVDYYADLQSMAQDQIGEAMQDMDIDPEAIESLEEDEMTSQEGLDELRDFCEKAPESIRKTADSLKGQYPDGMMSITYGFTGENEDQLVKIQFMTNMARQEGEPEIEICFETNGEGEYNFTFGPTNEEVGADLKIEKAENGVYAGSYKGLYMNMPLITGTYEFDTNTKTRMLIPAGKFTVNFTGAEFSFTSAPNADGDEHTFALSGLDMFTDNLFSKVWLTLTTADQTTELERPEGTEVDVTDYSEEEFKELGNKLLDEIEQHLNDLGLE